MRKIVLALCSLVGLFFMGCDAEMKILPYEYQLVVEGTIEAGEPASVFLSTSVGLQEELDTLMLLQHIIDKAEVTVTCDNETERLVLNVNEDRYPRYEYKTPYMVGEVGKTYRLKITYDDKVITARTYIPEPVAIDRLWYEPHKDNTGYIHIKFRNESSQYYRMATRIMDQEDIFTPALYGNMNSKDYKRNELLSLQLNRGLSIYPKTSFETHFPDTCVVQVKLSTQNEASYEFWKSYQNELMNSQNPIFPSSTRLKSNIKGGVGVWCGLGSSVMIIDINKFR